MVEAAFMVAMAVVLDQAKVWTFPQGGSITLGSSAPIWVLSRRHGARTGILGGLGAGILLALLGGTVVHPIQGLLDYPLAYGALGLAGLGRWWMPGALLGALGRFACHVLAGVVFFAHYAPAGWSPWHYALVYNAPIVVLDSLTAMILLGNLVIRAPFLIERAGDCAGHRKENQGAP